MKHCSISRFLRDSPVPLRIAIVTDEPGWHGAQLTAWFAANGATAQYVALTACHLNLSASRHGLVLGDYATALPDAVFVRGIPGGSLEAVTLRLDVLHHLAALGVPVFNSALAIERTVDKARTSLLLQQHGIATPPTFVGGDLATVTAYVRQQLAAGVTLVKKPLFGSQGKGLRRIRAVADLNYLMPGEIAYLQQFVGRDCSPYRDCRVLVIDGRAVAAMERQSHHWITNRAQGASCHALTLDAELAALAERATVAVGADYAGVDLLRDETDCWLVTEVNGIPAWQGLQQATGIDISALLGRALLRRLNTGVTRGA